MTDVRVDAPAVGVLLQSAARALAQRSDSPRLDAELLLAHVLDVDRARLVLDRDMPLGDHDRQRFDQLVRRRLDAEPVAYLIGRRGFRHLELAVDPRALIPRPETELLVEVGLGLAPGASVLDVGTGSGAVALALADERPDLVVRGVDVSPQALALAEANALRLRLDVSFTVGDLLDGAEPADAVLANLPYVPEAAPLPDDVARHEPALALFGGADGLDVIRRLLAMAARRSWPALLALEIGEAQGSAVRSLLHDAGFAEVEVRPDLAGRDRVAIGRRTA